MWPLTGMEILQACNGKCLETELDLINVHGTCIDSRKVEKNDVFVAIKGEKFDGHDFVEASLDKGACLALVCSSWGGLTGLSSDKQKRCIIVEDTVTEYRNIASFFRNRFSFPVIGVGGSNGKTTTKEMLSALLGASEYRVTKTEKSENGFLGLAVTLTQAKHSIEMAPHALVLEIGIDNIGAMEEHLQIGNPDVVLLTALGPEHLCGLKDWDTAISEELKLFNSSNAKRRIWQTVDPNIAKHLPEAKKGDVAIIQNGLENFATTEGDLSLNDLKNKGLSLLKFTIKKENLLNMSIHFSWIPSFENSGAFGKYWEGEFLLNLPGPHNAANLALALGTALSLGRTPREIAQGWNNFIPPAMRSRISVLKNGCILYDDCYNSSPASLQAALKVISSGAWNLNPKILVLGDMLDLGEESKKWHMEIALELRKLKNAYLCFYGNAMYDVFNEIKKDNVKLGEDKIWIKHLTREQDPCLFFDDLNVKLSESLILVKGSRGMDLGRVVSYIQTRCQ